MKNTLEYKLSSGAYINVHATLAELSGMNELDTDRYISKMFNQECSFTPDQITTLDSHRMVVRLDNTYPVVVKVEYDMPNEVLNSDVIESMEMTTQYLMKDFCDKVDYPDALFGFALKGICYLVFDMSDEDNFLLDIQYLSSIISSTISMFYNRLLEESITNARNNMEEITKLFGITEDDVVQSYEDAKTCVFFARAFNVDKDCLVDFFRVRQVLNRDVGRFYFSDYSVNEKCLDEKYLDKKYLAKNNYFSFDLREEEACSILSSFIDKNFSYIESENKHV